MDGSLLFLLMCFFFNVSYALISSITHSKNITHLQSSYIDIPRVKDFVQRKHYNRYMHCLKIKHVHLSSVPISLFIPSNLSSLLHLCLAPSWLSSTQLTCFIFLVHLRHRLKTEPPRTSPPQVSSSSPQIVVFVSVHRTISLIFLCRCRHARIQAQPQCSSSPSLSRYRRYRTILAISYVLQHKPSNLQIFSRWLQYFQVYKQFHKSAPDFQILHFKPFKNSPNSPRSLRCFQC